MATNMYTGESLARSEYTVVDIGSEDNPRLVRAVASYAAGYNH